MYCQICGKETPDWEFFTRNNFILCPECFYERADEHMKPYSCSSCGKQLFSTEIKTFEGKSYCNNCAEVEKEKFRLNACPLCGIQLKERKFTVKGKYVCENCYRKAQGKEKGFGQVQDKKIVAKNEERISIKKRFEKVMDRIFLSDSL